MTVYVEAYSAHPLEVDAAELYAPPDGDVLAAKPQPSDHEDAQQWNQFGQDEWEADKARIRRRIAEGKDPFGED